MTSKTHPEKAWVNAVQGLALTDIPSHLQKARDLFIESFRVQKNRRAYGELVEIVEPSPLPSKKVIAMQAEYEKDIGECLSLLKLLDEKVKRLYSERFSPERESSMMPEGDFTQKSNYEQIFDAAKAFVKKEEA